MLGQGCARIGLRVASTPLAGAVTHAAERSGRNARWVLTDDDVESMPTHSQWPLNREGIAASHADGGKDPDVALSCERRGSFLDRTHASAAQTPLGYDVAQARVDHAIDMAFEQSYRVLDLRKNRRTSNVGYSSGLQQVAPAEEISHFAPHAASGIRWGLLHRLLRARG